MKKVQINRNRWGLTLSLMLFIFLVIAVAMLTIGTIIFALFKTGQLNFGPEQEHGPGGPDFSGGRFIFGLLQLLAFSTLLSFSLSWFFGRRALDPMRKVIDATRKVAAGDFSVRVELKGVGELRELSSSFNKMMQELASIETLRSDFVNNMSHQFKTPLMSLRGFAKLLKEDDLSDEEQQEYLDIIIAESERLASLATKTLALSKYEHVEIIADKTTFRLDEQIRQTVALAAPQWAAKNLDIRLELEEILFYGSEDLIQQIWVNLLDNATKFSAQGGKIIILLQKESDNVRFTIHDDGIGMESKVQTHCFDKFYQEDASQSQTGNGLGLAIVKRVAELHNGSVDVRSTPGEGSTFIVNL